MNHAILLLRFFSFLSSVFKSMKKQKIVVGNWKMYKTIEETREFILSLPPLLTTKNPVYIAPPFTSLFEAAKAAANTPIVIGAQNMWMIDEGPFTGEISSKMLVDAGAHFVLLGHSERRLNFQESNFLINLKLKKALDEGLSVILLVGETLKQRNDGDAFIIIEDEIKNCLHGVEPKDLKKIMIAYEPIWAIGTGETATKEVADEIHLFIRETIALLFGEEEALPVPILYGGSVKPQNTKELLSMPHIDGVLVGGASLSLESFAKIVNDSVSI